MDAKVVEPRRVVRQTDLRGDDRYPLPVVEVDDAIASQPAGPRAARLEQRRREQQAHADPSSTEPQQKGADPPRAHPREPDHPARRDEPRVGAVDEAPPLPGIDIWKGAFRHDSTKVRAGVARMAARSRSEGGIPELEPISGVVLDRQSIGELHFELMLELEVAVGVIRVIRARDRNEWGPHPSPAVEDQEHGALGA